MNNMVHSSNCQSFGLIKGAKHNFRGNVIGTFSDEEPAKLTPKKYILKTNNIYTYLHIGCKIKL